MYRGAGRPSRICAPWPTRGTCSAWSAATVRSARSAFVSWPHRAGTRKRPTEMGRAYGPVGASHAYADGREAAGPHVDAHRVTAQRHLSAARGVPGVAFVPFAATRGDPTADHQKRAAR